MGANRRIFYAAFGDKINAFYTAAGPNQISAQSEDSLFPVTNLYDQKPWKAFMFGTYNNASYVDLDSNMVYNGDFENTFGTNIPGTGWTRTGTQTVSKVAGVFGLGGSSMKFSGGNNGDRVTYLVPVKTGKQYRFTARCVTVVGSTNVYVRFQNMTTGNYLAPGGTWTSLAGDYVFSTDATADYKDNTVTIESYETCGKQDTVLIKVTCCQTGAVGAATNDVWFDDVLVIPAVNCVSIHGHNFIPALANVELWRGDTSPASINLKTLTVDQPSFFALLSTGGGTSYTYRYYRLKLGGSFPDESTVPYIGEMFLGHVGSSTGSDTLRTPEYGYQVVLLDPQDRVSNDIGASQAFLRTRRARRLVNLDFKLFTAAEYTFALQLMERSRNGAIPGLFIIDDQDTSMAIYGRFGGPDWRWSRPKLTRRDFNVVLEELPFPVVV